MNYMFSCVIVIVFTYYSATSSEFVALTRKVKKSTSISVKYIYFNDISPGRSFQSNLSKTTLYVLRQQKAAFVFKFRLSTSLCATYELQHDIEQ